MGSYDGAETCELIGIYMLSLISAKFKDRVGLYRDDGLAVCRATPKEIEKTKQEVSNIFKSNGLKIAIEANKKTINFLDVTFDLTNESYSPFMKPNNKLLYVHRQNNHPPALLKNIPENINKFLMTPALLTKKPLMKVATTTSSPIIYSQPKSATEIAKEKSYGIIHHGTPTWRLTWEESS